MKTLSKILIYGIILLILFPEVIIPIFKTVFPRLTAGIEEFKKNFEYVSRQDLREMAERREKELLRTAEPVFTQDDVKMLLEANVISQNITVKFDTVLHVNKEIRHYFLGLFGYNNPLWTENTYARMINSFQFRVKAGFNLKNAKFLGTPYKAFDTLYISLPQASILSCEALFEGFKSEISEQDKQYKLFINNREIQDWQRFGVYNRAKQLVRQQAIDNGMLETAEITGKTAIENFLKKIYKTQIIKIEIN